MKEYFRGTPGQIYKLKSKRQGEIETFLLFTCDFENSPDVRFRKFKKDKRLIIGYRHLTDILNKYDLRGTFFVEGKICANYPELVKELDEDGHEIGSHGLDHVSFTDFWPIHPRFLPKVFPLYERKINIRKSKQAIYDITKRRPISFRAPYLATDEKTLMILENEGFLLDSSLYNPAFGKVSYPYHPSQNDLTSEGHMKILEVPITVSIIPQRKFIYRRYPLIFELEEKQIEKTVYHINHFFSQKGYPFTLFVTMIHPYELCSPVMHSKVKNFLRVMNKIEATSLNSTQLIKEYERLNVD